MVADEPAVTREDKMRKRRRLAVVETARAQIAEGREVGTVTVTRDGADVPHVVTFAFAFFAFHPDGVVHTPEGPLRQPAAGRR